VTAATARTAASRTRLDQLLVERTLAPSRERARALILAGAVRVAGEVADRAALPVRTDAVITVDPGPRFVSRGGEKLDGALADFGIDPTGTVALDVGASTGGFTDRLLQGGAARVYAIDVGHGQLAWRLRNDARVTSREGVNARTAFALPQRVDLIVADLSFISLAVALPPSFVHLRDGGDVIALVKPQFEAGRAAVGRGGIVRDPVARAAAVERGPSATRAQLSSFNSAKGRMLATMLIWREGGDYLLQLPRVLCEPIRKKLGMYVLRAKVKITDAGGEIEVETKIVASTIDGVAKSTWNGSASNHSVSAP